MKSFFLEGCGGRLGLQEWPDTNALAMAHGEDSSTLPSCGLQCRHGFSKNLCSGSEAESVFQKGEFLMRKLNYIYWSLVPHWQMSTQLPNKDDCVWSLGRDILKNKNRSKFLRCAELTMGFTVLQKTPWKFHLQQNTMKKGILLLFYKGGTWGWIITKKEVDVGLKNTDATTPLLQITYHLHIFPSSYLSCLIELPLLLV